MAPASHLARTYIPRLVKDKVLLEEGKVLRIRFNRNDGPVLAENLRREDAELADMCANVKECEGLIRPLFEHGRQGVSQTGFVVRIHDVEVRRPPPASELADGGLHGDIANPEFRMDPPSRRLRGPKYLRCGKQGVVDGDDRTVPRVDPPFDRSEGPQDAGERARRVAGRGRNNGLTRDPPGTGNAHGFQLHPRFSLSAAYEASEAIWVYARVRSDRLMRTRPHRQPGDWRVGVYPFEDRSWRACPRWVDVGRAWPAGTSAFTVSDGRRSVGLHG